MSFIKEVNPEEATGELKEMYDRMLAATGRVAGVMSVLSLSPNTLKHVKSMGEAISFGGSSLGRRTEEMIATYISRLNDCEY